MSDPYDLYIDLANDILENAPDDWDDDIAGGDIATQYVRHLEKEVQRLGGSLYPHERELPPAATTWGSLAWTQEELADLFYDALLRDARSEGFSAQQMRKMANNAARGVSWPMPIPGVIRDA